MKTKSLILIVDDNPQNLQVLGNVLKENGHRVAVSTSGSEALEYIARKKPDLILLDIMMPQIDGFETCQRLKHNEETRDIPVLFITARTDTSSKLKAFETGGVDYITKPFLPEEVLARVNINIKRQEYERTLRENDRMKSNFVSSVSHELRTPLASILGFTSAILRDKNMAEQTRTHFLTIIHDESKRLSNLIEDVLSISRIESGDMSYYREPVMLKSIVTEVFDSLSLQAEDKDIQMTCDIADNLPAIHADRNAMKQALLNLVGNAVKFTEKNGVVNISVKQKSGHLQLQVEDTGLGIPEADMENIFEKFFRVHRPDQEIQGTGLGLPIVKDIVDFHNGSIDVFSEEGKGSKFVINLPLN